MNRRIVLTLIIMFSVGLADSEDQNPTHGKYGLTGMISDSHLDILIPMFLNESFYVAPAFGYADVEDVGSEYSLGIMLRGYTFKNDIASFIGLTYSAIKYVPNKNNEFSSGESQLDYLIGPHLGLEKYFGPNFCIGIMGQVNFTKTDKNSYRLGYPDKSYVNTATSVYLTIYNL